MVLQLIQKFTSGIQRVDDPRELVPILRDLAATYGAQGAILAEFAPDQHSVRTLIDTDPARELAARALVREMGPQAAIESLRRAGRDRTVLSLRSANLPPTHPYRRFWMDLWFGDAMVVPVWENNDVAGALCLTGRSMSDNLHEIALSHVGYILIDRLRRMSGEAAERGGLTRRELEILRISAQGLTSKEIGMQLGISMRTVNAHVDRAVNKLGARNRMGAVVELARRGLLDPSAGAKSDAA